MIWETYFFLIFQDILFQNFQWKYIPIFIGSFDDGTIAPDFYWKSF